MNITFFAYNIYGMGGTVRTVVNTANYLASQGHKIEIVSVRRTSYKPLFLIHPNIKITPIVDARRGKRYPKSMFFWKKIIMRILLLFPSIKINKTEDLYKMFNLYTDFMLIKH